MDESDYLDTYSTKRIFYDKGTWRVEKKTITQKYNPIHKIWKKIDVKTEILPISAWEPSLTKTIETEIVFSRSATDSVTLLPLFAWFRQKVTIKADPNNQNEYLNQLEGRIFLIHLDVMVTQPLSMRDPRVKRGKVERITEKKALKLIKEGTQVFEERGNELMINISPT
jgi:hypothetical protein